MIILAVVMNAMLKVRIIFIFKEKRVIERPMMKKS